MRDYAKQRPYSIKIRSDSAPSFPDHSNNSLLHLSLRQPFSNYPIYNLSAAAEGKNQPTDRPTDRPPGSRLKDFGKYNRKTVNERLPRALFANSDPYYADKDIASRRKILMRKKGTSCIVIDERFLQNVFFYLLWLTIVQILISNRK